MCQLSDFGHLSICEGHKQGLTQELSTWHLYPVGKVVLDIGAGCGETAQFYLNHGAEKVICVEGSKNCLVNLRKNFQNDQRIIVVPYFVDKIKIDIDGSERGLVFESHFPYRLRKLRQLAPYTFLNILEENWGNPFRKALRKLAQS
jgi:hypothetical protein